MTISTALSHYCATCARLQTPNNPAHLPGSLKHARDFGELVAIDLFSLADCYGEAQSFLNIIDVASAFQLVTPVPSKRPSVVWGTLLPGQLDYGFQPNVHRLSLFTLGRNSVHLCREVGRR